MFNNPNLPVLHLGAVEDTILFFICEFIWLPFLVWKHTQSLWRWGFGDWLEERKCKKVLFRGPNYSHIFEGFINLSRLLEIKVCLCLVSNFRVFSMLQALVLRLLLCLTSCFSKHLLLFVLSSGYVVHAFLENRKRYVRMLFVDY